jgi:hypothetical protein
MQSAGGKSIVLNCLQGIDFTMKLRRNWTHYLGRWRKSIISSLMRCISKRSSQERQPISRTDWDLGCCNYLIPILCRCWKDRGGTEASGCCLRCWFIKPPPQLLCRPPEIRVSYPQNSLQQDSNMGVGAWLFPGRGVGLESRLGLEGGRAVRWG